MQLFDYIKRKFSKHEVILIQGSTAHGKVKNFSDFDFQIYTSKVKIPYYSLILFKNKLCLISIYFYKYLEGEKTNLPKKIKIIKGVYNKAIDKHFKSFDMTKSKYTAKEQLVRNCQLTVDMLFKYLRHKDKKHLEYVNNKIEQNIEYN